MPSISRRELLGGTAALAGGSYGAYRLYRGRRDASFDSWTPENGTWPLPRYDPANTAHNPNASPPREEPTRREIVSFTTTGNPYFSPIVGPERIAVFGDRLVSLPASGGDPTLSEDTDTPLGGFGPDGRLHAVHRRPDGERATLAGYEGGERVYRHVFGGDPRRGQALTLGATEAYVGTYGREIVALHPGAGRDWTTGGTRPALANGRLYATGHRDGTVAYEARSGLDRRISVGPKRAWTGTAIPAETYQPAVADGRLVVGSYGLHSGGNVVAYDAETGERLWDPRSVTDTEGWGNVTTPAVVGERGYLTADAGDDTGAVACLDLTSGETLWRDDIDWSASQPVVGGAETLLVSGFEKPGTDESVKTVRAYDAETGERLWTERFTGEYTGGMALAGGSVFVTAGDTLYELA